MSAKTYTFYAPCPTLDIEAMQTWLEDMSLKGYLLKNCSKVRHKFEFYRIEPLPTRYRLTPVSDKIEEWNLRPDEEFVSISEAYGWEHVCSNHRLHIFRTFDDEAREIHTDPMIQAQAVRKLGRQMVKTTLVWLSMPLLYCLILLVFGFGSFWQSLILDSQGAQISVTYFVLVASVIALIELLQLGKLHRQLKLGQALLNRKEWSKKAPAYRRFFKAYPIILVILAFMVIMTRAAYRDNARYRDLPPVGTELPFLSVADMAEDSNIPSAQRMEDVNFMRNWSHVLSPVNYKWAEIVEVVDEDGTEGLVSIQLSYHEVRFGWLADRLSDEYLAKAQRSGTEMIPLQTDADLAYFYHNEYGDPSAVLQYGNTVVCVEFPRLDSDDPALTFEYWIRALDNAHSR